MEIKKEINTFNDLLENSWSGAKDILEEIAKYDMEDKFMEHLEQIFYDSTPTDTEVNDYIWFECGDWLYDQIATMEPDDIDNIYYYFKNKSMCDYYLISVDDEEVLEIAEQFNTIQDFFDAIRPYDTWAEFKNDYNVSRETI